MDQADLASALFGNLLAVLVVGSLARMAADVLVGVAWQVRGWGSTKLSHHHPSDKHLFCSSVHCVRDIPFSVFT